MFSISICLFTTSPLLSNLSNEYSKSVSFVTSDSLSELNGAATQLFNKGVLYTNIVIELDS